MNGGACRAPPPASSGFLNLLTLSSARVSAGLISYRIHLRDSPFRAFLLSRSRSLSPAPLPSWRCFCSRHRGSYKVGSEKKPEGLIPRQFSASPGLQNRTRLQGFAPRESPSPSAGGLDQPGHVALLSLLPSRVFSPDEMDAALNRVSPHVILC